MRTRGSMSIVDSAWLAVGATSRRHSAASHADVQMTVGVEPSSRAGVFRRMLTSRARRRHARASMSCCIPPTGATTPSVRRAGRSPCQTGATRSSTRDPPAYLPWRNGPRSHGVARRPSTRAPHCSTVSSGRGRREPRAVAVANRATMRERLPGAQGPPPRSLAVDVTSAAGRPGGAQHREPEIAAHGIDAGRVPHPDGRGFDGTVWRLERRDQAAEPIGLLDDLDGDPCARQVVRGRKPGETSPDHRDGPHGTVETMGRSGPRVRRPLRGRTPDRVIERGDSASSRAGLRAIGTLGARRRDVHRPGDREP